MKKLLILGFLTLISLIAVQAQNTPNIPATQTALTAVVLETAGKVEYKTPGADWLPAKVGTFLRKGTIVSTGFRSTASIKIGEAIVEVKPVTRLTLEDLVRTSGGTQTQLFLTSGRVKAEVTPSKTEIVSFKVRSTQATASVRGTGFEFDGFNLLGLHGKMDLRNNWGQFRVVNGGEFTYLATDNSVSIPIAANPENGLGGLTGLVDQAKLESDASNLTTKVSEAGVGNSTVTFTFMIQ